MIFSKNGFKFKSEITKYTPEEYRNLLDALSKDLDITTKELAPLIDKEEENNFIITVDTGKSKGNIQLFKIRNNIPLVSASEMILEGENLDKWKERSLSQPITLGVD